MKRIAMMKGASISVAEDTSAAVIATQQWRLIGTVASAGRGFRIKVTTLLTMLNLRPIGSDENHDEEDEEERQYDAEQGNWKWASSRGS